MLLSQMKGSFAGTLSANGRLLTDQATGAAREDQSDSFPWRGSVRYPTAVHELEYFTPSARLDCEDGRTLLIELGDPYCSNDGQWVTSQVLQLRPHAPQAPHGGVESFRLDQTRPVRGESLPRRLENPCPGN
jgi:hypothetical protein